MRLNPANINDTGNGRPLSSRDLVILPALIVATIAFLVITAELVARLAWRTHMTDACEVWKGNVNQFIPGCATSFKLAESPPVVYKYNDCGYRNALPCRRVSPGQLRVAVMGSSIAHGYAVGYGDSFVGRAERQLADICGRQVDLPSITVDEARGPTWNTLAVRAHEALSLRPDAIILTISPFDLLQYHSLPKNDEPDLAVRAPDKGGAVSQWMKTNKLTESFAIFGAQHFVYANTSRYIPLYLRHKDDADYLRPPFSAAWSMRLMLADRVLARVAHDARERGVPVMLIYIPSRIQALVSAQRVPPPGDRSFRLRCGRRGAGEKERHDIRGRDQNDAARAGSF